MQGAIRKFCIGTMAAVRRRYRVAKRDADRRNPDPDYHAHTRPASMLRHLIGREAKPAHPASNPSPVIHKANVSGGKPSIAQARIGPIPGSGQTGG